MGVSYALNVGVGSGHRLTMWLGSDVESQPHPGYQPCLTSWEYPEHLDGQADQWCGLCVLSGDELQIWRLP